MYYSTICSVYGIFFFRCSSGLGAVGGLSLQTHPATGQTAQDSHRTCHQNIQKQALPGFTWSVDLIFQLRDVQMLNCLGTLFGRLRWLDEFSALGVQSYSRLYSVGLHEFPAFL